MLRVVVAVLFAILISGGYAVSASAQDSLVPRIIERFEREAARQSGLLPGTLRTLAGYGPEARAASPTIAKLIESDNPAIRTAAVRALGYIGHDDARQLTPKLLPFLHDADVRTAWVVAETLGRLGDPASTGALAIVAELHWYPPVRAAAAEAIRNIGDEVGYIEQEQDFSAYLNLGRSLPWCGQPYGPDRDSGEIAVDDGRLKWSNRGEFGGELIHVDGRGVESIVLEDNVVDVYPFAKAHVIVAGLSHMGLNYGRLYLLERQGADWAARVWRELPGAIVGSRITGGGELLVHTYGGILIVSGNGDMRMAECPSSR